MSFPCTSEKEFCESELVPVWACAAPRILGSRNPEIPEEGSEPPGGLLAPDGVEARHCGQVQRLPSRDEH